MNRHIDGLTEAVQAMEKYAARNRKNGTGDPSLIDYAIVAVAAYEAHMRPEVTSVEDAENLPNGTIVQDDMDLLLRVDGEWRVVEYQDSRAYPITPACVIHWGGSDA